MRDTYTLASRMQIDTALEVEPVRAGMKAKPRPSLLLVEFPNQGQQAMFCSINLAAQLADLSTEALAVYAGCLIVCQCRGESSCHLRAPDIGYL